MTYIIVDDGIIQNLIVCDNDKTANQLGALPGYDGATIGEPYSPPEPEPVLTLEDRVTSLEGDTEELHEALDMILTGYTGEEEGTDETGTAE